jgi:hypothetical protein
MITQIDLKFKGNSIDTNLFINDLYKSFNNLNIHDFDNLKISNSSDLVKCIEISEYIYLSASLNYLFLGHFKINDTFFDLRKENDIIYILFFFDINQFNYPVENIIDILEKNSIYFLKKYNFNSLQCTIDNGNLDETIFNEKGKGIYYKFYIKS